MSFVQQLGILDAIFSIIAVWLVFKLFQTSLLGFRGTKTTPLQGPPRKSILFGLTRYIQASEDPGALFEQWAIKYGPAFKVHSGLGSYKIMIADPKAVAHFYARETFLYIQTPLARVYIEKLFGRGLLWAEGDSHKRQRRALSPAFNNTAIKRLISVFYSGSYKIKANWESILDSSTGDSAVIDVQTWMNNIALDSIGIAGFGHDFGTLDGKHPAVLEVFEALGAANAAFVSSLMLVIGPILPLLLELPAGEINLFSKLRVAISQIADDLLARTRKEKEGQTAADTEDRSIIGLLVKSESEDSHYQMSREEIMAQNVLLLAGYETTSISLTWALIELSRNVEIQEKLRKELSQLPRTADPTWEQLISGLPYLDSVAHETLRLHPPVSELSRVASEDDVIPFAAPLTTNQGETRTDLTVKKGTIISIPIGAINRLEAFWGPSAKEFRPERWLEDADIPAKQIQGHRHLLTFSDGPRLCLGRYFALAEFKTVLSVLIRNYTFELPDGPETKIEKYETLLPRPRVAGQKEMKVPLIVKRVE